MIDQCGRQIEYLRLSITQNCNLRCIYCRPQGQEAPAECGMLTPEEFGRAVMAMVGLGIRKVRITGGEPLTRSDLCEIIQRISEIEGIEDLSMTTNGIRLADKADHLKQAGLKRINISLDSLKPERYTHITGGGKLSDVLAGVERAVALGLKPVKINVVLIRGINDDEVDAFMDLTRELPLEVRFIELMPVGKFGEENREKIVYNSDIIHDRPQLQPCGREMSGQPADYYRIEGYQGRIGFISPMSHKFCHCCNRIRLTCDGKIKPCLGNNGEVDLIETLRNHPGQLEEVIRESIFYKPQGHHFDAGFRSGRGMDAIGG